MSKKAVRTVAFQIDDWDFLKEYDQRQQDSGLSVKNYFISLIKADIAQNQTQKDSPAQDSVIQTDAPGPEQNADISSQQTEEIPAPVDIPEQTEEIPAPVEVPEQTDEPAPEQNADDPAEDTASDTDAESQEQADEAESQQIQPDKPAQNEEMMNFFAKITKGQREALDSHKNATGETVGGVLNRIIDDFLDHTDSLPEGFEEAFQRYSQNPKLCDTTASAKIPVQTNQELTDYLNSFGGSRNALMASLVELELKGQEMAKTQAEDQGMDMV